MSYLSWLKSLRLDIHSPGIGFALIILAFTHVPIAIKAAAELACIGETSNLIWKQTNSHKGVNSIAVNQCNGGVPYEIR